MKKNNKKTADRVLAVSAVVGVILMTIITVVTASAVYMSVLATTEDFTPQEQQTAQIVARETSGEMTLSHMGGTPLGAWELRVNGTTRTNGSSLKIGETVSLTKNWSGPLHVALVSGDTVIFFTTSTGYYNPPNLPPEPVNDTVSVYALAAAVIVNITANDIDPEGDMITIHEIQPKPHGTVEPTWYTITQLDNWRVSVYNSRAAGGNFVFTIWVDVVDLDGSGTVVRGWLTITLLSI